MVLDVAADASGVRSPSLSPSWNNVDAVVIAVAACSVFLTCTTIDLEKERPILIANTLLISVFIACRYQFAWWTPELHPGGWLHHLSCTKYCILFWTFHLLYAISQPEDLAPMAHRRLIESGNTVMGTCALFGFLLGAEPAVSNEKLWGWCVLFLLISVRILILGSCLPTSEAALDFASRAFTALIGAPSISGWLGLTTRKQLVSTAAELVWLRSHSENLEAARQASLIRDFSRSVSASSSASRNGEKGGVEWPSVEGEGVERQGGEWEGRERHGGTATSCASSAVGELDHLLSSDSCPESKFRTLSATHSLGQRPPTPEAVADIRAARDQALWRTLNEIGISPASDAGDSASAARSDVPRPSSKDSAAGVDLGG